MRFTNRKRRNPPAVIIVSLIDILIVLLIFLMVTTTFKQRPTVKLTLPESKEGKPGSSSEQALVVTIATSEPFFYFRTRPLTLEKLQSELAAEAQRRPDLAVVIDADKSVTIENTLKVIDAAKAAKVQRVTLSTRAPARP
jgi:biopolymer transport protein ExbD